jgi:hypothetical protein
MIILRFALPLCSDRQYCSQVAGAETPRVQISQLIAIGLEYRSHTLRHSPVRVHIEEDGTGVASPYAQAAMTTAPHKAATGSIHIQPRKRPNNRPTMTSTETAASTKTSVGRNNKQ